MTEAPLPVEPASERHPRRGYLLASSAAALWAVNGAVSKVVLASGMSSVRLTEVRSLGSFLGLMLLLAVTARDRLRLRARDLPSLALFGVAGLALVQWFYFLAIHRLAIGIALLVEYIAPLFVALLARFVFHQTVRRRVWVALGLAITGLALIVDVGGGGALSATGLAFAAAAAFAYVAYLLLAERAVAEHGAVALLGWGFGFATLFFSAIAPWWSFPGHLVGAHVSLLGHLAEHRLPVWLLICWVIVLGTIAPFLLLVSALRHLSATRVGIIAMLEPVLATAIAWLWLGESLAGIQIAGAVVVLVAIVLAQTAR